MNTKFKINILAEALLKNDSIEFAFLFGSAQNGTIKDNSDLDLAVYFKDNIKIGFDELAKILRIVDEIIPGVNCDLSRLNTAGEVLRMEALKGRLLFVKDIDKYADFYSRTCAEYEDTVYWMSKQLLYRRQR
jgi:uncharacterized protein